MKTTRNKNKVRTMNPVFNSRNIAVQVVMFAVLLSFTRCAPLASEMQGARLAGKNTVEITPGYSTVQFSRNAKEGEGRTSTLGKLRGMQVAYGISEKVDLRFRVENYGYRNLSMNAYSIGPKFMLVRDRMALYMPLWFVDNRPALLQPAVLFTVPVVKDRIEFNPSFKNILSVGGYAPTNGAMMAFNAGFGISTNLNKWAVRPEYGVVYDVMHKTQYTSFSLGVSINLAGFRSK